VIIVLPFPPSVNHYWRRVGYRTLISREGRTFQRNVRIEPLPLSRCPLCGLMQTKGDITPCNSN